MTASIQTPGDEQQHQRRHDGYQPVAGHGEAHHAVLREAVRMRGAAEAVDHTSGVEVGGAGQQSEHGQQAERLA